MHLLNENTCITKMSSNPVSTFSSIFQRHSFLEIQLSVSFFILVPYIHPLYTVNPFRHIFSHPTQLFLQLITQMYLMVLLYISMCFTHFLFSYLFFLSFLNFFVLTLCSTMNFLSFFAPIQNVCQELHL